MEPFLGIIIDALVSLGIVTYFKSIKKKQLVNAQSTILLDKKRRFVSLQLLKAILQKYIIIKM